MSHGKFFRRSFAAMRRFSRPRKIPRLQRGVLLSAFSDAGQRCAAASRIIVSDSIYERFRNMLVERALSLKVGISDDADLGPVINEKQLNSMIRAVDVARQCGAKVLLGGYRLTDSEHKTGFYFAPTFLAVVEPHGDISTSKLFCPLA